MTKDPRTKYDQPGQREAPQSFPGIEQDMVTKPDYGLSSYTGSERLSNKVALITGGDSGIGRAVAVAFAKEGANVAITYLETEEADATETLRVIKETTDLDAIKIKCDFSDSVDGVLEEVVEQFGSLDILVNNAALQTYYTDIKDISTEDMALIYQINVIAPFLLMKQALAYLKPGGCIINTVSVQAYQPSSLLLPYAASKGALVALTKALSQELIEKGIRVNAVAPGPIWSPLNTHGSPPEKLKKFGENSLFGRPGQPIEVAPVYVLLASDAASFITGEIYGVTGETAIG